MSFRDILNKNGYEPSTPATNENQQGEGAQEGAGAAAAAPEDAGAGSGAGEQELDEQAIIAALSKKGIAINSLADLAKPKPAPTEEEQRQAEQARRDEIRKFGLNNKKVTSTELDSFVTDTNRPARDVAFEAWVEANYGDVAAADRPSAEDLADEFNEEFLQFADEDDTRRIRKEKAIKTMAEQHLRQKWGKVYGLDQDYDNHVTEQQLRHDYTATIDQVFQAIGDTLTFKVKDGKDELPYSYKLPAEAIASARESFLSDGSFNSFGKQKLTAEAMRTAIEAGIKNKHMDEIISYLASTHASARILANEKGRRGIPENETGSHQHRPAVTENKNMRRHISQNQNLIGATQ